MLFENLRKKIKIKEKIIDKLKQIRQKSPLLRPARLKSIVHRLKIKNK